MKTKFLRRHRAAWTVFAAPGSCRDRRDCSQNRSLAQYFGEGIAILGDKIFQLTWQSHVGFVYTLNDFHFLRQFSYSGEGWGLTTNGRDLFMSDGTSEIRVLDPNSFAVKRRIKVHDGATPVTQLNELEFGAAYNTEFRRRTTENKCSAEN